MKILVTGFEAFDGEQINPSKEIVENLHIPAHINLQTVTLPVEFEASRVMLEGVIHELKPDYVICLGQAGGRECVTLERVAINIDDARIPDNSGFQPSDMPICKEGPPAYFSNLPLKAIIQHLSESGIKVNISNSAGTYVCNHVMYCSLHMAATKYPNMKAGFIHVPYMKEQTKTRPDAPSIELQDMIHCIETIITFLG